MTKLAITIGILAISSCQEKPDSDRAGPADPPLSVLDLVKPAPRPLHPSSSDPATRAVQVHCSRCHALPDPTQLTRKLWINKVLPEMGCYLGMQQLIPQYASFIEKGGTPEEAKLYRDRGIYPTTALIPQEEWDLIVGWFLQNSPETLPPSNNFPQPPLPDGKFEIAFVGPKNPVPETTLIHIDPIRQQFISSDAASNSLALHDSSGRQLAIANGPSPFTVANTPAHSPTQQFLAIGTLQPNDAMNGSVWSNPGSDSFSDIKISSLPLLKRPVDAVWHDLDHDGSEELIVAEYGNKTGQLSLFKEVNQGSWSRTILNHSSGNIRVEVVDMNKDGWEDLVVLRAQEFEDVLIYYNTGQLKFHESHLLRFPPYWGNNDFDLADWNQDGHLDLLLANGDNADSTPVLKNFHGVYLYLNDRKGGFQFNQSFPLHGAYGVRSLDYDLDGDLDFVTFSTFPDFEKDQIPVQIMEQTSHLKFKTYSIPSSNNSRWIVMDVGDLDGDGDMDIIFGANLPSPSSVPQYLRDRAELLPGAFLVLKNLARR
ncbi:FG-GAP repeat domain-containing protein [Haloferula chungangensis]|uniref:FG-GAP repeat domain-containing protein n=1 Tax=Haloferula chungangensis TaxID=1048331 RepID=A0ABW2LC73_9BACT